MNGDFEDVSQERTMSSPVEPEHDLIESSAGDLAELFMALAAAQAEMSDPAKNKVAKVPMKAGGTYSYKYADLADLLKIIRPAFGKQGLALFQVPTNPFRGGVKIVTRLCHKSGQWLQFTLTMPVGDDKPQTLGSAITYGRRYAAAGIAAIAPDEDEDGQAAQDAAPARMPATRRPENGPSSKNPAYSGTDHQRAALKEWMILRRLETDRWQAIHEAMVGHPFTMTELDSVIKSTNQ